MPDKQTTSFHDLNDEQIEEIAERAADRAIQKLTDEAYRSIGKSIVNKLFYIVGVLSVALYFWAIQRGWIKP